MKLPKGMYCVVVRRISMGDSDCGDTRSLSLQSRHLTLREANQECGALNLRNHSTLLDYDVMTENELRAAQTKLSARK